MTSKLYSNWFVSATIGATSAVSFWDWSHSNHDLVYVIRSIVIAIDTGTGKAWVGSTGPRPPWPTDNSNTLFVVNNLFTTPLTGPTNSGSMQCTIPMAPGASLFLQTVNVKAHCVVSGWKLQLRTPGTVAGRY